MSKGYVHPLWVPFIFHCSIFCLSLRVANVLNVLEYFTCPALHLCRSWLYFSQGMSTRAVLLLFQELVFRILDMGSSRFYCFPRCPSRWYQYYAVLLATRARRPIGFQKFVSPVNTDKSMKFRISLFSLCHPWKHVLYTTTNDDDDDDDSRVFVLYFRVYTLLLHMLSTFYIEYIVNVHKPRRYVGEVLLLLSFQIKKIRLKELKWFSLAEANLFILVRITESN